VVVSSADFTRCQASHLVSINTMSGYVFRDAALTRPRAERGRPARATRRREFHINPLGHARETSRRPDAAPNWPQPPCRCPAGPASYGPNTALRPWKAADTYAPDSALLGHDARLCPTQADGNAGDTEKRER
jgi:hypothetical protein